MRVVGAVHCTKVGRLISLTLSSDVFFDDNKNHTPAVINYWLLLPVFIVTVYCVQSTHLSYSPC